MSASARQLSGRLLVVTLGGGLLLLALLFAATRLGGLALDVVRSPLWFVGGVGIFVGSILLGGPRLWLLLPPEAAEKSPGPGRLGALILAAGALNLVMPGPVGDLALVGLLKRRSGVPVHPALAAVAHARFTGLTATALLMLLSVTLVEVPEGLGGVVWGASIALGIGGLLLGLCSLRPAILRAVSGALLGRWGSRPLSAVDAQIARLADALGAVGGLGPRRWLGALTVSLVIQGCVLSALLCSLHAVGAAVPPDGLLFAHSASTLSALAAVLMPGGALAYEAVLTSSLSTLGGLSVASAGATLAVMRMVHLSVLGISGVLLLAWAPQLLSAPAVDPV